MPDSERFTLSTSSAWRSTLRFLCTTPIPPCCAMAIASDASVTVSIAAEQSGICKRMPRVNCVDVSVSVGSTSERAGSNNTSSKVSPSEIFSVIMARYITPLIFVPQHKQTPAICRGRLKKLPKRRYYFHKRRSPAHGRDGQHRERQKTYTRNARWPSLLVAQPSSLLQADKMTRLPVS